MGYGKAASGRVTRAAMALRGAPVLAEVRNRFDGRWSRGFQVVEALVDEGRGPSFRVRRLSDGRVLPELFGAEDIVIHVDDDAIIYDHPAAPGP